MHLEQDRAIEPDAQRTPAKRGVLLLKAFHVRQELVVADVERAKGDMPVAGGVEDGAIKLLLRARPGIRSVHSNVGVAPLGRAGLTEDEWLVLIGV